MSQPICSFIRFAYQENWPKGPVKNFSYFFFFLGFFTSLVHPMKNFHASFVKDEQIGHNIHIIHASTKRY